ncbi:MAG: hypothetical protein K6L76_13535 [Agarilytica sp.]
MKTALFSILFFSGVFSLTSVIFYFGDWKRLMIVAFAGVFVGLVAAPELEPKAFKMAWAWQLVSGAIAGVFIASVFSNDPQVLIASSIICAFIGTTAKYWINHVQVP